jgi:hypothetical protein
LSVKNQSHIAARDLTFSPHNPQKTKSQAANMVLFREAHTCHVSKVPPSHYLFFTKPNATTTTHKTERNNTQDQTQQHAPFSTMGSAFMLM